jgi:hypothetical protein
MANLTDPTKQFAELEYACCICGEGIDYKNFDPIALALHTCWNRADTESRQQNFYCHLECFVKAAPFAEMYVTDPNWE